MKRLMISAMSSGSGKTVMTCALLLALKDRGLQVRAFKCGPDYLDPMLLTRTLEIPCRNLDLFLQGPSGVRRTLAAQSGDLALLEGAMGFYDGVGGGTDASAWDLADRTDTPVVLVLRPKGQSVTLAAQVRGMLDFRRESHVAALLLTECGSTLYAHLAPILRRETGLPVLGYLPPMEEARLESRHLGLNTEVADFARRLSTVARTLAQTVDLDALTALAQEGEEPCPLPPPPPPRCRIAVAWDRAFRFYYQGSLEALERSGAELVRFRPMEDPHLPEDIHGLYLGGGYPELYASELSRNQSLRRELRRAVLDGMPTLAECGGFLYLQETLQDKNGVSHPMAGVLGGGGFPTDRLQRFGYVNLTADRDSMLFRAGERVPAHEFHYWDCTENGADLLAEKPGGKRWRCGYVNDTLYAAFPHLHLGGELPLAERFAAAAIGYKEAGV